MDKFANGSKARIDWAKARSNVRTSGALTIIYPMGPVGFAGGGCCLHSYLVEDENGQRFAADENVLLPL